MLIALLVALQGCVSIEDVKPSDIYSDIKLVYQDVKYVVYEIEQEKERISDEGFGDKQ